MTSIADAVRVLRRAPGRAARIAASLLALNLAAAAPAAAADSLEKAVEEIALRVSDPVISHLLRLPEGERPSVSILPARDLELGIACDPLARNLGQMFKRKLEDRFLRMRAGFQPRVIQDLQGDDAMQIFIKYELRRGRAGGPDRIALSAGSVSLGAAGPVDLSAAAADAPETDLDDSQRACVQIHRRFDFNSCTAAVDLPLQSSPRRPSPIGRILAGKPFTVLAAYDGGRALALRMDASTGDELTGFIRMRATDLETRAEFKCTGLRADARPAAADFKPFDRFEDCRDCPPMIALPAGEFRMGSPEGEAGRDPDESAPHRTAMPRMFAIGAAEVSVAEWSACAAAGACLPVPPGQAGDQGPAAVSARDAEAYAEWLSRRTGHRYRLPTEAEWEYAARLGGTGASRYHWGDLMEPGRAVCRNCDARPALHPEAPSPRRADRNGLTDMHGNVWEWTSGCWTDRPGAREDCSLRALRGGSWRDDALSLRAANRNAARPEMRHDSVGFRLVRELE